jgi:hypothetical protein
MIYAYSQKGNRERGRPVKKWTNQFQKIAVGDRAG